MLQGGSQVENVPDGVKRSYVRLPNQDIPGQVRSAVCTPMSLQTTKRLHTTGRMAANWLRMWRLYRLAAVWPARYHAGTHASCTTAAAPRKIVWGRKETINMEGVSRAGTPLLCHVLGLCIL